LGQFRDSQGSVLLRSSGGEGGESDHEEVQSGEGDEVDSQLSEIRVELTGESEAAGDSGHGGGDEMVQISVSWGGELEGSEADVIKSLVVNDHALISIFN
jgi:hypothetical protein